MPELGFPLGTRLQMTWLEPGLPNSLTPGRRPRTTLTPSLALRDGVPVHGLRHPRRRPAGPVADCTSSSPSHCARRYAADSTSRAPIDAPNWHNDSFPGSFYPRGMRPGSVTVESRTGRDVVDGAARRGHDVTVGRAWSEGRLCAVARDPETGVLSRGGEPARHAGVRGRALRAVATDAVRRFRGDPCTRGGEASADVAWSSCSYEP